MEILINIGLGICIIGLGLIISAVGILMLKDAMRY